MPVYEYNCPGCKRKVSIYVRRHEDSASAVCPRCGSKEMQRLFSTFSVKKTYMDIYEDILSDRQLTRGLMRNDPKALVDWNRRMTRGMEDNSMAPEYEEMVERMDKGEFPANMMKKPDAPAAQEGKK
jgi:putative FmdB family regulatory protein